jgi:thymidylate kinase
MGSCPVLSDNVRLVSFSGIDGAGKSTQIDALCRSLQDSGRKFLLYTFWDDVVVLSKFREHMSLKAFKGDKGVGSPDKPIVRRDKNVRSWYLTATRLFLYALDALRLRRLLSSRNARQGAEFVIFDRYIYDELANLPLQHAMFRVYVKLLLKIVPRPDVALLVDADPEAAASRKPEYPLEFVRHNREAYLRLSRLVKAMTVVPPLPIDQASEMIQDTVSKTCPPMELPSRGFDLQFPAGGSLKSQEGMNSSAFRS